MGGGNYSKKSMDDISRSYANQSRDRIFKNRSTIPDMDPVKIDFRESRDNSDHPNSLAIIYCLDVTGSLGHIPENMVKHSLGNSMQILIKHGLADAQVNFCAVGDHYNDKHYLQIGQFEATAEKLSHWLTNTVLEGGGGGQKRESYALIWLFAGRKTSIDCFEKRGTKGFLFTMGDESFHPIMEKDMLKQLGFDVNEDITAIQALKEAESKYHVYHFHINQGSYPNDPVIFANWKQALGERFIVVEDYTKLPEIMASTAAIINGADKQAILNDLDDKTRHHVSTALVNVNSTVSIKSETTEMISI